MPAKKTPTTSTKRVTQDLIDRIITRVKDTQPPVIVLVKVGDFYESFDDDSMTVSQVCGTSLSRTSDKKRVRSGIPYHAIAKYLELLAAAGHSVAIIKDPLDGPK